MIGHLLLVLMIVSQSSPTRHVELCFTAVWHVLDSESHAHTLEDRR